MPDLYTSARDAQGEDLYLFTEVVRVADVAALPEGSDWVGLPRGVLVTSVNDAEMWIRWHEATELMTSPQVLRYKGPAQRKVQMRYECAHCGREIHQVRNRWVHSDNGFAICDPLNNPRAKATPKPPRR